jgi:hypothetical protein
MAVFWVVAPCSLVEVCQRFRGPIPRAQLTHRPDDGGSKDLWNVGKLLPDYTALQPRRQPSSYMVFFCKWHLLYELRPGNWYNRTTVSADLGHARWYVYCWRAFPQSYLTPPIPNLVFEQSWDVPPYACWSPMNHTPAVACRSMRTWYGVATVVEGEVPGRFFGLHGHCPVLHRRLGACHSTPQMCHLTWTGTNLRRYYCHNLNKHLILCVDGIQKPLLIGVLVRSNTHILIKSRSLLLNLFFWCCLPTYFTRFKHLNVQ